MGERHIEGFEVKRLDCAALKEIYALVDLIRSDEVQTAERRIKVGYTRMRTKLATLSKLCKAARQELLEMRDGKVRSRPGQEPDETG